MRMLMLTGIWLVGVVSMAIAQELPLFDAHIHYSERSWGSLSAEEAATKLRQAGVRGALVSSTPNEGTQKLRNAAPEIVIPFLRPYRHDAEMSTWHDTAAIVRLLEEGMESGRYRGIGEYHLDASNVDDRAVRRSAELAREHGVFLHAHTDAAGIEALARAYPDVRLLWAHAGVSTPPERVGTVLDGDDNVWVELSLLTPDIATFTPQSNAEERARLDPEWRRVLIEYPERFLIGTDTWVTGRWRTYEELIAATRAWLRQLPEEVAEKIAYKNGERLFESHR